MVPGSNYLCECVKIVFWRYLLMGGELGTETNIGLLVGSSGMSQPFFALIGNTTILFRIFVLKSWCF